MDLRDEENPIWYRLCHDQLTDSEKKELEFHSDEEVRRLFRLYKPFTKEQYARFHWAISRALRGKNTKGS